MKKGIKRILALLALVAVAIGIFSFLQKRARHRELVSLYEKGLLAVDNKNNQFYPQAQLKYYDSLLRGSQATPRETMAAEYFKADALLKLGREKEAIDLLDDIIEKLKIYRGQSPDKDPRRFLALAWLRLGERNNCIGHHMQGSCVFPIRGDGVYTDPYASEKAIAIYQQLMEEDHDDLESRWLLNLAYMTIGQYPSKVPAAWLIPGLDQDTGIYKVKAFQDMAGSLGLAPAKNEAGGTIIEDFDNDGYLDIVISDWDPDFGMHAFRNNGDGTFTDISESSGLSKIKGAFNLEQVDYNNDGWTDIFVLRGGWRGEYGKMPKTLLRNNGDGTFTDVTVESGLISPHPTQTATWADFNNDGWPDVFIGQETTSIDDPHPCELWINNRDGSFSEVAKEAGCSVMGFVKGVTSADYDNDRWPDLFLSERNGGKVLLHNKGIAGRVPRFEDVTHRAGLDKDTTYTFPTWFWDYDNDGWPDIFVCGYKFNGSLAKAEAGQALHIPMPSIGTMYLYRNNHDGTFTNVSKAMGLDKPVFAMGSNFGDIDNDGWLDMYLGTGNPDFESLTPNRLFMNRGGRGFVDVTRSARVGNLQKGHGVAIADVNNDGYPDIFIETGGAYPGDAYYNSFYVNPGQNDNNWIDVRLVGVQSNRSALGARIEVSFKEDEKAGERTVYRDVNSGGSFGASPLRQQIGIGPAKRIDSLVIRWPTSGIVQVFKDITPRQFLVIHEGDDKIEHQNLKSFPFKGDKTPLDCLPPGKLSVR